MKICQDPVSPPSEIRIDTHTPDGTPKTMADMLAELDAKSAALRPYGPERKPANAWGQFDW